MIVGRWRDLGKTLAARSPEVLETVVAFLEHVAVMLADDARHRHVHVQIVSDGDARRLVVTNRIAAPAPAPALTAEEYELLGQLAKREAGRVVSQDPGMAVRLNGISARCARMVGRAATAKPTGET